MRNLSFLLLCLLCSLGLQAQVELQRQRPVSVQETQAVFVGQTPALRNMAPMPATTPTRKADIKKNRPPRNFVGRGMDFERNPFALPIGPDASRQLSSFHRSINDSFAIDVNIEGLTEQTSPHDPSGDIGRDHYIQIVNVTNFRVFNKDGTPASDIIAANTLWNTLGFTSAGDPIVLYDQEVNRWIITEFPSGNQLLFAISASSDPMGEWMVYNFATPIFPDYPKYSIWNNAYVVTTNEEGTANQTAYFIDRQQMLAGAATVPIQRILLPGFANGPGFFVGTPVDWSGNTPPPANALPMVIRQNDDAWGNTDQDQIDLFSIDVDFDNPDNTVFTLSSIPTAPFDTDPCSVSGAGFQCIPQLNGDGIDGIPAVIMNQVHYQNFGTHESIVLTFITDVSGGQNLSGIRWMELRRTPDNEWSLYQEGTWAPDDGLDRYVPAIAMDAMGNITIAYSASSEEQFVSLRMTGRRADDPLNEMTLEEMLIIDGKGPINDGGRYGDYAQMSVDPIDGRTFWFTSEYPEADRVTTRIASWSFGKSVTDFAPTALITPIASADLTGAETVQIAVKNVGLDTQSVFQLGYIFEDGPAVVDNVTFTLYPDSIYTHTFTPTVDMSAIGDYQFKIFTDLNPDQARFNDTLRVTRTKLPRYDAGIESINGLPTVNCSDAVAGTVTLRNFSGLVLTSVDISIQVNEVEALSIPWTGSLAPGANAVVPFNLTGLNDGLQEITASTSMPNGQIDQVAANNQAQARFQTAAGGEVFVLNLTTDEYPEEVSWEVSDEDNNVLYSGGPYTDYFQMVEAELCLDPGACYTFTIFDAFGDGLSSGGYMITNPAGEVLVMGDGNYTDMSAHDFCGSATCLLEVDIIVSPVSTGSTADGAIMVNLSNTGSDDYQISIDGGQTFTSLSLFTDLMPGDYDIVVTNNGNCNFMETVTVAACALSATAEVIDSTITINVAAGNTPYTYSLDNQNFQASNEFPNLSSGDYTVYIKDSLGCVISIDVTVDPISDVVETQFGQRIVLFPSPTDGVFRIRLEGLSRSSIFLPIEIFDSNGRRVQGGKLVKYDNDFTGQFSLAQYPAGTYFIRVIDQSVGRMLRIVKR